MMQVGFHGAPSCALAAVGRSIRGDTKPSFLDPFFRCGKKLVGDVAPFCVFVVFSSVAVVARGLRVDPWAVHPEGQPMVWRPEVS